MEIDDGSPHYNPLYYLNVNAYKSTKFFQDFVDIFRNESPLFFGVYGEIDETQSNYADHFFENIKQLPFRIFAGGAISIKTEMEEVEEE